MYVVSIAYTFTFGNVLFVHLVRREITGVPLAVRLVDVCAAAGVYLSGLLIFDKGFCAVEGLLN